MKQSVTIKARLYLHNATDAEKFKETTEQYRKACNYVSEYIFQHNFLLRQTKVQEILYAALRSDFFLKSQFAVSVTKTVIARYKTVRTQLKEEPYRFTDKADGKKYQIPRNLEWLQKPIVFKRPQADFVRNRDYSFLENGAVISINTLQGRVLCDIKYRGFEQYLSPEWKFGTAKLFCNRGKWYFHISVTREIPDYAIEDTTNIVGIDRGLRFLATAYDSEGKTVFSE